MTDQRSAATALYPHLKSQERQVRQPSSVSVAHEVFPHLAPKPKLPSDPYLRHLHLMGLVLDERQGRRR
jgi:hypothetical protein